MTTIAELQREMVRLSKKLDDGIDFLHRTAHDWAEAEDEYRLAQARNIAQAPEGLKVDQRKAWVDERTSKERRAAHLADAMRQAALEAVRSRRAQLSALQTIAAAVRAEAEIGRYGPERGP